MSTCNGMLAENGSGWILTWHVSCTARHVGTSVKPTDHHFRILQWGWFQMLIEKSILFPYYVIRSTGLQKACLVGTCLLKKGIQLYPT